MDFLNRFIRITELLESLDLINDEPIGHEIRVLYKKHDQEKKLLSQKKLLRAELLIAEQSRKKIVNDKNQNKDFDMYHGFMSPWYMSKNLPKKS